MNRTLLAYLYGFSALVFVILLRWLLQPYFNNAPPLLFFLFIPLVAAWTGGAGPGLVLLMISALLGRYLFVEPQYSLAVHAQNRAVLLMYIFQGSFTTFFGATVRRFHQRQERALTAQTLVQASLTRSELRYRSLVAATASIVWTADAAGNFVQEQPSWQSYTGQSPPEYLGWGWLNALRADCREHVTQQWNQALHMQQTYSVEAEIWCAELQQYRFFVARAVPLNDQNGHVVEWIGTVTDIHESKTALHELSEAKEAAEAASRTKTQFLANMSHEIRTPLGAIMGFTDVILERCQGSVCREHAQTVKRNATHLFRLVNEVLDVSKVEADRLELEMLSFPLEDFLIDLCSLFRFKAQEKGLDLTINVEGQLPDVITSDPLRLRQVLQNLVGNAIKFTEQGRVDVIVRSPSRTAEGIVLEFLVSDTGIGLLEEQIDRLFKPFSQADDSMTRRFGGTGLGLYLSKRLAKLLGGDLELVSSVPAKGSQFRLTVLAQIPTRTFDQERFNRQLGDARPNISTSKDSITTLAGLNILVVDDVPDNQVLVAHILDALGAVVETAGDGFEGIEKALQRSYDVILMDVQMPKLDGLAAARRLRDAGYTKAIIALTAHAMKSDRERCLHAGCDDYLSKPINQKELVSKLLNYRKFAMSHVPIV